MIWSLRLYLSIILNTAKTAAAYKAGIIFQLLLRGIILFASVSIWRALFGNNISLSLSQAGITVSLKNMITYMVLSQVLSIIISTEVIREIHEKINTGQIALDLLKPAGTASIFLYKTVGVNLMKILFQIIPFFIVSFIFFKIELPSISNLILFFISAVNGFLINFLLYYIFGLTGFWYMTVNHLDFFLKNLAGFFSGALIPLWFFPDFLKVISNILPFKFIIFTPIAMYLGKIPRDKIIMTLMIQYAWILLLIVIEKIIWRMGIKKLVIQGG